MPIWKEVPIVRPIRVGDVIYEPRALVLPDREGKGETSVKAKSPDVKVTPSSTGSTSVTVKPPDASSSPSATGSTSVTVTAT